MVGIAHASHRTTPTIRQLSTSESARLGSPAATFNFDERKGRNGPPSLSPAQEEAFKADFRLELASIAKWSADENWQPASPSNLQVFVSHLYKISKSLVPAWFGHGGWMEFPAWRVIPGEAAIAHELAHVYFPNGNRFLAEGLAIYLQAKVGGNSAFPNFGRDLHAVAREVLRDMVPQFKRGNLKSLSCVQLVDLDRIATPSPLKLMVGRKLYDEDPFGQAHIYPIVGSFFAFLVEMHGTDKFRSLFMRTPLIPFECDAGSAERWIDVYGLSLIDLEGQWKSMIASFSAKALKRN